ncbi:MAG TPA: hypothetical protein VFN55_13515 [Solirubrobacteraceae bacterium]|nr:hypothetical protein [Solirubrobacteraceae bacterium]
MAFHVELRHSLHRARAFNLSREDLDARFARPWAGGETVQYADRAWDPDKARLTVYEGREIEPEEMGMDRGWATVGRTAQEVTETVLAEALRGTATRSAVETFKAVIRGAARTPMSFSEVVNLAVAEHPGRRVSECLAMAEQAVWELLHQQRLALSTPEGDVAPEGWEAIVLRWESWARDGADAPTLRAIG